MKNSKLNRYLKTLKHAKKASKRHGYNADTMRDYSEQIKAIHYRLDEVIDICL